MTDRLPLSNAGASRGRCGERESERLRLRRGDVRLFGEALRLRPRFGLWRSRVSAVSSVEDECCAEKCKRRRTAIRHEERRRIQGSTRAIQSFFCKE